MAGLVPIDAEFFYTLLIDTSHGELGSLGAPQQRQEKGHTNLMKRLTPYIGIGLAAWVASASLVMAQGDFYIELRGPESTDAAPNRAAEPPRPVQQISPVQASPAQAAATRPIQQIGATPAPAPATPGRYGPIRSTDTLWTIAEKYTRSPVTVQQTMVALYHLNPTAFVRGNINNLQKGAQLRLPTDSQARQRSAGEAQAEFGRLTRQGNRRVARGAPTPVVNKPAQVAAVAPVTAKPAAAPTPQPSTNTSAPAAALPPVSQPNLAANGLTEPKAAPVGLTEAPSTAGAATKAAATEIAAPPTVAPGTEIAAATPEQAEDTALSRLQLQLMDELREQVSMSNEQLAALADNNQALRQHLAQLSEEVAALKASTDQRELIQDPEAELEAKGWLQDLLNNPINLALILILPALLLLALFTLWWRNRERKELVAQEQELTETSMLNERDEFDDLFTNSVADELDETDEFAPAPIVEQDIDEDAFARFLEEQQQLEEGEAQQQIVEPEPEVPAEVEREAESEWAVESELEPEAEPEDDPLFEDTLFEDETALTSDDSLSNDELDDLFSGSATAEDATLTDDEIALSAEETFGTEETDNFANDDVFGTEETIATNDPVNEAQTLSAAPAVAAEPSQGLAPSLEAAASLAAADNSILEENFNVEENFNAQDSFNADDNLSADPLWDTTEASLAAAEAEIAAQAELEQKIAATERPLTAQVAEPATRRQDPPPARLVDDWPEPLVESMSAIEPDPEPYVSVDELMADAELGEGPDPNRERHLGLELDDYANVIGQGQGVDIDIDEGGMSGQLDLARAYIEIDDIDSARDLLNEALERGNADQQKDAKKLLQRLAKRS